MAGSRRRDWRMVGIAIGFATVLWGIAHGSSSIERGVDIPVSFHGLADDLVITDQSSDRINIRVRGSRGALRNLSPAKLEYVVDVTGAKPGTGAYEIDGSRVDLPRGATIVSRSPANLEVEFERRGRRAVRVRADVEGEPAPGYVMGTAVVEPTRVWLTGARSEVMRLDEVVTEPVDVSGAQAPVEREVRLSLGGGHVWSEESKPIRVTIPVEPVEGPRVEADQKAGGRGR